MNHNLQAKDTEYTTPRPEHFDLPHSNLIKEPISPIKNSLQNSDQIYRNYKISIDNNDQVRSVAKGQIRNEDFVQRVMHNQVPQQLSIRRNEILAEDNLREDLIVEPQNYRQQQLYRTPTREPQNQRTFLEKCPSWLKSLIFFIICVALCGFTYWLFFKRGKVSPLKKHRREEKTSQKKEVVADTTQKVKVQKVQNVALVAGPQNTKQDKKQEAKVSVSSEKVTTTENKLQNLQKNEGSQKIQKKQEKVEVKETKTPSAIDSSTVKKQQVKIQKVNQTTQQPVKPPVPVTVDQKVVYPLVQIPKNQQKQNKQTKQTNQKVVSVLPIDVPTVTEQKPKELQKTDVVTQKVTQKSQQTKVTQNQNKPDNKVQQKTQQKPKENPEQSSTIVVYRGNKTYCPDDQFLLNGNCMSCPPKMVWNGLDCVLKQTAAKHLKRSH